MWEIRDARGRETRNREIGTKRKSRRRSKVKWKSNFYAFHRRFIVKVSFGFSLGGNDELDCDIWNVYARVYGSGSCTWVLSVPMRWISIGELSRALSGSSGRMTILNSSFVRLTIDNERQRQRGIEWHKTKVKLENVSNLNYHRGTLSPGDFYVYSKRRDNSRIKSRKEFKDGSVM